MYPEEMVNPMKKELTDNGFKEILTTQEVDEFIKSKGVSFVVVNSVCGCSAANARPSALSAVKHTKAPDKTATAFAGVDNEGVARIREYMLPYPPSSPSMALFKDGELVHCLERHHIEGTAPEVIEENLKAAFDEYC